VDGGASSLAQVAGGLGMTPQSADYHISRMDDPGQLRKAMATNGTARQVTAFGETKGTYDWARDPRCKVSAVSLLARLKAEWEVEAAITTPAGARAGLRRHLTAREAAAIREAAELVRQLPRLHRYMGPLDPSRVATEARNGLMRDAAEHSPVAEIARAAGMSHQVATRHIRGGSGSQTP
jgi:hypothetical protein